MRTEISRLVILATSGLASLAAHDAHAQFVTVSTANLVNTNLRFYTQGQNYPIAPATLTIADVPFDISPLPGTPNSFGILQSQPNQLQFILPVNVASVDKVYTLINTGWGQLNAVNGRIEFVGSDGSLHSVDLIQGGNVRDHWLAYNQFITDPSIVTTNYGGGTRLDRQTFDLPPAFLSTTLTEIRLIGNNPTNPAGAVFLAAATVEVGTPACDNIDFNGDGLFPDDADLVDFLTVLAGGECSTGTCNDIDFNNDGLFPDDADLVAFLTVLAGGPCS